jgi:hypothetical protein
VELVGPVKYFLNRATAFVTLSAWQTVSDQVQVDEMRDVQQLSKVAIVRYYRYRRPTQSNQECVDGIDNACTFLILQYAVKA